MTPHTLVHPPLTSARAPGRPWIRASSIALEYFLLLPAGLLAALVWANTAAESYFAFASGAAFWANDVAMVLFFGLLTKEVVEATAPDGVLHSWRKATMPLIGAAGAAITSAVVYVWFVGAADQPMLERGWPLAAPTDLALAYLVARVIFGAQPIVPFVLLLGLGTTVIGFLALPLVAYPPVQLHLVAGGALMGTALLSAAALRHAGVRSFWPYLVIAGGLSWFALFRAGLHPGLALVPIVPFMPHAVRDRGFFVDAPPQAHDTLSRFEQTFRVPMHGALLLVGLVNGGVVLHALEIGALALPVAVLAGKPLGVLGATAAAVAAGFHFPRGVGRRELFVAALLASSGLTVSLFMASATLGPGQVLALTRMGVLVSAAGAPLALLAARLLHVGRFQHCQRSRT